MLRTNAPERVTVAELSTRFAVTPRTIERDLVALRESGVPIVDPAGSAAGYTIDLANSLPPVHFSATEATAVVAALARNANGRLADANRAARRKVLGSMSTVDPAAARRLSNTIHDIQTTTDELDPLSVIQAELAARASAVGQPGVIEIRYRSDDATISTRAIEPVGLVIRDGVWVVLAWCRVGEGHRSFRLDRIDEAAATGEAAPERASDELSGWLGQPDLFSETDRG